MLKEKYVHKAIQKQNINLFVLLMISLTRYWPRWVKNWPNFYWFCYMCTVCCPPYIDN